MRTKIISILMLIFSIFSLCSCGNSQTDVEKIAQKNTKAIVGTWVVESVEKGEIISGIGEGFGFESKEKPHVHLTILKNGESINPQEIIK